MTVEEYKAELERLRRERDAVLTPLDEQIERLTAQRRQASAGWNAQVRELDQQYVATAPYKAGDIVRAKSVAGLTEVYKITTVQIHPWKDGSFVYWGTPQLKSGKWSVKTTRLGDIVAVESTEGK